MFRLASWQYIIFLRTPILLIKGEMASIPWLASHRLQNSMVQLHATLPRLAVESEAISLAPPVVGTGNSDICLGRLIAPRGLTTADIEIRNFPSRAMRNRPLYFDLELTDSYDLVAPEELELAVCSLVLHARVEAALLVFAPDSPTTGVPDSVVALVANINAVPSSRRARVSVDLPVDLCHTSFSLLEIRSVSVAGQPIAFALIDGLAPSLPLLLPISFGLQTPLKLEVAGPFNSGAAKNPAIASDGSLYVLKHSKASLLAYSFDGTPLGPTTLLEDLGLSTCGVAAAVSDATDTLLLADYNGSNSVLVAIDLSTRTRVLWKIRPGGCYGIAVLPGPGLAISSCQTAQDLYAYRLADGEKVSTLNMPGSTRVLAAEPASDSVFVSIDQQVYHTQWTGTALESRGVVEAAGKSGSYRPVAVMQPAPNKSKAYLVVGTHEKGELKIISLPELHLVHTHQLTDGIRVAGLAGDPSGSALVICDYASNFIHALSWPLPGMPPLV